MKRITTFIEQTPTWATPTPYPVGTTQPPDLDFGEGTQEIAETLVQGYNALSTLTAFQALLWLSIFFVVIAGVWTLLRHWQKL